MSTEPKKEGQEDIQQGIATKPNLPKTYKGRGGCWACEKCMKTAELPDKTFDWTCEGCNTKMYTMPLNECPLERFRRFVLDSGQKIMVNSTEKRSSSSGDSNPDKGSAAEK